MHGEVGATNGSMSDETFDATALAEIMFRKEWSSRLPHISVDLFGEIARAHNVTRIELDQRLRVEKFTAQGLESAVWEDPEPWTDRELADLDARDRVFRDLSEYEGEGAHETLEDLRCLEFKKRRFEHDQKALGLQPGHTVEALLNLAIACELVQVEEGMLRLNGRPPYPADVLPDYPMP